MGSNAVWHFVWLWSSGKIAKHHHYHFKGRSAPLVWKLRKLTTVSVTDVVNSPRGRFPRISTFVSNIFHLCVKPTAVCILCAHWADHKILVSGDWPDRKRLVNRDCPSEGCDRRPGTTPHQRPCRDLLKRYSNLLKQYSNDFNSFFSALHWLEARTKKQNSWNLVFLELEYLKRVYSGSTRDSSLRVLFRDFSIWVEFTSIDRKSKNKNGPPHPSPPALLKRYSRSKPRLLSRTYTRFTLKKLTNNLSPDLALNISCKCD